MTKNLLLVLLLASSPAFAGSDPGKVNCKGTNPRVNSIDLDFEIDAKGAPVASMLYTNLNDDAVNEPPYKLEFRSVDFQSAAIEWQHADFIFAHHNTVAKLIADADIFGGDADDDKGTYNGVLFYQSGNGNSRISRFNVVCRKLQ